MRSFLSVSFISLLATGALADSYSLDSNVSAVTVYAGGATLTRTAEFDIPAGRHTLEIADIPYQFIKETLRLYEVDGLEIGASQIRRSRTEAADVQPERRAELEDKIKSLEAQILVTQEDSAAAGLIINAANARIKLLDSIGGQQAQGAAAALEAETISVETLTALVSLVGSETLNALQEAQAARVEIAKINRRASELQTSLQQAREELADLSKPSEWRYIISFDVEAEAALSGTMQLSYVFPGGEMVGWKPVYDLRLDTENQTLSIDRKISIWQLTGETWDQAEITVSTAPPFSTGAFEMPYSNIARYQLPPPPPQPVMMRSADGAATYMAPEVVAIEEPAHMGGASFAMQGLTATYILPVGTVIKGADDGFAPSLISLDTTVIQAEITARANMGSSSTTAYVIAEFTNESGAPYMPGGASFFLDGAFVRGGDWTDNIDLIAAGATATLDFGQINGLMVERNTLRREDGESGVLTTSNDRVVEYNLSVENVGTRAWDVVIYDRVPVSEQEDLIVDWSARPRPTQTDVDGRRGVLAWEFGLEGGESKSIKLSYELQWPEGNELRVRP